MYDLARLDKHSTLPASGMNLHFYSLFLLVNSKMIKRREDIEINLDHCLSCLCFLAIFISTDFNSSMVSNWVESGFHGNIGFPQ